MTKLADKFIGSRGCGDSAMPSLHPFRLVYRLVNNPRPWANLCHLAGSQGRLGAARSVPRRPYLAIGGRQFYDFAFFPTPCFHVDYTSDNTCSCVLYKRSISGLQFPYLQSYHVIILYYILVLFVNCLHLIKKTASHSIRFLSFM